MKQKINNSYFSCGTKILHFVATLFKCRKGSFLGGFAQIITISHRVASPNLLQYYIGGGGVGGMSLQNPNLYYVINGRPQISEVTDSSNQFSSPIIVSSLLKIPKCKKWPTIESDKIRMQ